MKSFQSFATTLQQERNFIAAVLDTVDALVIVLDVTGRIVRFNRACEKVSGYQGDEVLGQLIWEVLIPPDEQEEVIAVFEDLRQQQAPNQYENHWQRKDQGVRLIRWSNTLLTSAAGQIDYIIGTGIDVTQQHQTERELAWQHQQQQLLGDITQQIQQSLELAHILQITVSGVRQLLACDHVIIVQQIPPTSSPPTPARTCQTATVRGQVVQESFPRDTPHRSLLEQGGSSFWQPQVETHDSALVNVCADVHQSSCFLHTLNFMRQLEIRSCLEVVIAVQGECWGWLAALNYEQSREWEADEIALMEKLANHLGVAIAQAQLLDHLEAEVEQRTQQLRVVNQQLEQEIQERIATGQVLLENQQQLAGILDTADEAIISVDSQQRIVMYNQGAERIFGYGFDEVNHQPLDILLPEAFRRIHRQHVNTFAAAPESSRQMAERTGTVYGQRKNGEQFPAEASISKLQTESQSFFTVMLRDISERQQFELALRRSEAQLRLITDALPALICYVDANQRYLFNNQTYADWFQRPVLQLQGQLVSQVLGSDYYPQVQSHIKTALTTGQKVTFEITMTTPDGQTRDLSATYIPDVDKAGIVKGFFGLIHDISDRKATERLKDEFVSVVSHELRTPLTSIHGSLKLLATNRLGNLAPPGQEMVAIALKNTERLTHLINDVLDLERIESGRITMTLQQCQVRELMQQTLQGMQPFAQEHQVELTITPLEVTCWADPDQITQVLTNLLSNAIKFSARGTMVKLAALARERDVVFQVQDQGRGIPEDKLDLIFDRFQQVDASDSRQRGGTGLGLAICQQIIQKHQGKIWVESTLGEGSTFFFTLPLCKG